MALRQRRRLTEARRAAPERANAVPAGAAASPVRPSAPLPTPHPAGPRMGARASGGPRARPGLLLLLPLLLLGLLAPGAQGARGRGGAEKNSYRRTVNTFSQSVSSLFGEDNVRAAHKVGAGLQPAVTLPGPTRTWLPGPAWAVRGLRGRRAAGRGEAGLRPGASAACGPPRVAGVGPGGRWRRTRRGAGGGRGASGRPLLGAALLLGPCPRAPRGPWAAPTPAAPLIHSFSAFE